MNRCFNDKDLTNKVVSPIVKSLNSIYRDKGLQIEEKQAAFDSVINQLIVDNMIDAYKNENGIIEVDKDNIGDIIKAINDINGKLLNIGSLSFKKVKININKDYIIEQIVSNQLTAENDSVVDDDNVHIVDMFNRDNNNISTFKEKVYGSQEAPYKRMESMFNKSMFNSMIIKGSGDKARPVLPGDIMYNIAYEKLKFMRDIAMYISSDDKSDSKLDNAIQLINDAIESFENNESIASFVSKVNKIEDSNYGIRFILDSFNKNYAKDDRFKHSKLSEYAVSDNNNDRLTLDIYNEAFMLQNIDVLIENNFKNVFDISFKNSDEIIKPITFKDSLSNIHNTWLDNDDVISAYKEAGSITKLIISAMKYYNNGHETNRKLGFNELNDAIGVLKSMAFSKNGNVTVELKTKVYEYGIESEKTNFYNLRSVIAGLNRNSPDNLELLCDILLNGNVVIKNTNADGTVTESRDNVIEYITSSMGNLKNNMVAMARRISIKNNLTSLAMNLKNLGLLNIRKECINPNYINYYNFIANYIQGAYRNTFMQRRIEKDDNDEYNLKMSSMVNRQYDMAKVNFESKVYSSNHAILNNVKKYANEIQNKHKSSYPKDSKGNPLEFSIESNMITTDDNGKILLADIDYHDDSYVKLNNLPLIGKDGNIVVVNAVFKPSGGNIEDSVDIKTIDGVVITDRNAKSLLSVNTGNGVKTSADRLVQDTYQINTVDDSELRQYLYSSTSPFRMIKSSIITIGSSWMNVNMYSNSRLFPTSNSIKADITARAGADKYISLIRRRGINNMPRIIVDPVQSMLNAIVANNNMISRDTVRDNNGNQLAITNMQRLINSIDEQIDRIRKNKNGASNRNPLSMTNSEFVDVLNSIFDVPKFKIDTIVDKEQMVYLGNVIEREININGRIKNRSDFNVAECLFADFVSSYLDEIYDNKSDFSFVTAVNSDKTLVNRTIFNRRVISMLRNLTNEEFARFVDKVNKNEYDKIIKNVSSDYNTIIESVTNSTGVFMSPESYKSNDINIFSDTDEIRDLFTSEELGMLEKLNGFDFSKLRNNGIVKDNFYEFNRICDINYIDNGYELMLLLCKYNNIINDKKKELGIINSGSKIRLIDQTHLIKFKDANGSSRVSMNPTLMVEYLTANYDSIAEEEANKYGFSKVDGTSKILLQKTSDIMHDNAINAAIEAIAEDNFTVRMYDDDGRQMKSVGLIKASSDDKYKLWFANNSMILFDVYNIDGTLAKRVRNLNDLVEIGYANSDGTIKWDNINKSLIKLNPLFEEYNNLHAFLSEQTLDVSVGGKFNHPIKGKATTVEQLRSVAQLAQTKRNVQNTASYHPLTFGTLDGLDYEMEIACITDIEENKSSLIGNNKKISPHDGATFVSPVSFYWWDNSMADTKAKGYNMKPFIHYFDTDTMTGGIIKTAGFPITNESVRKGYNYKNMAYKFLSDKWKNPDGTLISGNIFSDYSFRMFNADKSKVNLFNYIKNKYNNGLYFKASRDTTYKIDSITYNSDGTYTVKGYPVDSYGVKLPTAKTVDIIKNKEVKSNYDLWELFGAENSMKKGANGKLEFCEDSFKIVADIGNMVGVRPERDENGSYDIGFEYSRGIKSQSGVYQFMKHGNPHMVVTNGAIKQGLTNVDKHEDFYSKRRGKLNTYKINAVSGGIQLDKSHESAGHEISELTQVMSALSSMGFTKEMANNVYTAISGIVESSLNSIIEKHQDSNGIAKYDDIAAELIIRAMSISKSFDDETRDVCKPLIDKYNNGFTVTYKELSKFIHVNDNVFMNKAVPIVMSLVNKMSIKKSYSGGLNVINPSYGLVKMYGSMMWGGLGYNDSERIETLLSMQSELDTIDVMPNMVKPQRTYYVYDSTTNEDTKKVFLINTYDDYKRLNNYYSEIAANGGNPLVRETLIDTTDNIDEADIVVNNIGYKLYGRELAQAYYEFDGSVNVIDDNGETREEIKPHTLFELDSTRWMFAAKNRDDMLEILKKPYAYNAISKAAEYMALVTNPIGYPTELFKNKIIESLYVSRKNPDGTDSVFLRNDVDVVSRAISIIRGWHQMTTASLSNAMNGKSDGIVLINGQYVNVKSGSVKHFASEAIAPCIFRDEFGIPKDTRIRDITPEFFAKQFVEQMNIKLNDKYYHYALLHNSFKRSVFIYDTMFGDKNNLPFSESDKLRDSQYMIEDGSDYKWVLSEKGEKLFMVGLNDTVYNVNGHNIVLTNNPKYVLRKQSYAGINISTSVYEGIAKSKNLIKMNQEASNFENIIKKTFEQSKFIYNKEKKEGNDGSRSATYWTSRNKDGVTPIDAVFEIARNKAFSLSGNNGSGSGLDNIIQKTLYDKVRSMVFYIEEFNSGSSSGIEKMIYRNAIAKYNSFRKTLEILAARTPSQNMQSFMAQEIVEFDNSGLNQCFVSTSQIWFQGSDFDIDAVNFQSFKVDHRGYIIGWSPFFDNYNLSESMNIPFPTGIEMDIKEVDNIELFDRLFNFDKESGAYILKNKFDINDMSNYILECNKEGKILVPITDNTNNNTFDAVKEAVNGHNKYFTEYDGNSNGFKNYITHNSIKISSDIINLIESESSVDDQPDIKNAGNNNKSAQRRLESLNGNSTNTYSLFNSAQVGKDVVSITAAGLKNFFVITHSYNMTKVSGLYNMLKSENISNEEVEVVLGNIIKALSLNNGNGVKVGDNIYYTSSNLNPTDETKDIINEIASNDAYVGIINKIGMRPAFNAILNAVRYGSISKNNAIVLSALLSEATDNMKNLNLSKINATKDMAPLYIFGLTIGMDVADISKIMQSPTARVIDRIKHGNIYYGDVSSTASVSDIYSLISRNGNFGKLIGSVDGVLQNVMEGITLNTLAKTLSNNNSTKSYGDYIFNLIDRVANTYANLNIGDMSINDFIVKYKLSLHDKETLKRTNERSDYDDVINVLESFRMLSKISNSISEKYGEFNNFIDRLITIVNDRRTIENDNEGKNIEALATLDNGNKEMLKVALFAGLNKGVKATQQEIIKYNSRLAEVVTYNPKAKKNDDDTEDYQTGEFLKSGNNNIFIDISNSPSKFNLDLFVNNSIYRAKAIAYYAHKYQVAFNVLDIAAQMPHISSYANTANKANNIVDNMSPKKRIVNDFFDAVVDYIGYSLKSKDRDLLVRSSGKYINNLIFNSWLNSIDGGITFYVPVGGKYYVNNLGYAHSLTERINKSDKPKKMTLGNDAANATFIEYMNSYVLPNIKNGILSDDGSVTRRMNNAFINSLNSFTSNKTYTGSNVQVYAPPVSLRSNDEVDVMKTTEYKIASKGLNRIKYVNNGVSGENPTYSISNLLYLYNQILYSGAINDASLDEYLDNSSLKTKYLNYESKVTKSKSAFKKVFPSLRITDDIMMEIAPIGDGQTCGLPYHKMYLREYMQFILLKRKKKENKKEQYGENDYIDEDYISDFDINDYYDENYNEEYERGYSEYNKSKYETVDEILSDNSFTALTNYDNVRTDTDADVRYSIRSVGSQVKYDKLTGSLTYTMNGKPIEITDNSIKAQIVSYITTGNDEKAVTTIKELINIKKNCK